MVAASRPSFTAEFFAHAENLVRAAAADPAEQEGARPLHAYEPGGLLVLCRLTAHHAYRACKPLRAVPFVPCVPAGVVDYLIYPVTG